MSKFFYSDMVLQYKMINKNDRMRCFIASPVTLSQELYNGIQLPGKKVDLNLLHITYYFLGNIDKKYAKMVCDIIKNIDEGAVKIHIKGLSGFPKKEGANIGYLDITGNGLDKIYYDIINSLGVKNNNFKPHITIYRFKRKLELPEIKINCEIKIDRVCLYNSIFNGKRIYEEMCCAMLK
ncbi:hypothetical protein SE19_02505 [Acidiplasma aeolicum]|jgi:2'-5' RNA ligase|uniref:Phosphoesterase HXTX domain-containing protein n=3 Tax=Ferroplasmaceae TaxID=90142 RepID=A0A0Q0WHF3_9ARCH|nr:hypothetical protein TZ01_05595 [Acidiplasma sp. MBA-1]KPV47104.1 hypothetical protein SE19_02505 [Acidiplasma aeolicum]KQB34367.1 hypothetical protein AOG54_05100 [Acidiplasma aeolicum]KQB34937.1 hypothetical protein AOG55_08580 [Acidiplasma cupricumulans]